MQIKNFDPYEFSKKEINGVPVYYKNIPTAPCIHIKICFGVGSLHDPVGKEGLSHFLEHMIFDGAPGLPDKKAVKQWKKMNTLNSWNAWTWFTNTTYHLRCLPEKLDTVLEGMKNMIFFPFLKEEYVAHENSVITQEAWGVFHNEKYLEYTKEVLKNSYKGTVRERVWSPLGWPETISKISQEDLQEWHKKNYGRGNFFILICGAIEENDIGKIEKFLTDIPEVAPSALEFGSLQKPEKLRLEKRADEIGIIREQTNISFERLLSPTESASEEIRLMSAALLQEILHERLRIERALCYSVSTGSHMQQNDIGWHASINIDDKDKDVVVEEFWKAVNNIVEGKEIDRFTTLKQVRIDQLKSAEEITADIVENALTELWRYGKIQTYEEQLAEREKITYTDVIQCLSQAFNKEYTVTEIILPSKK